MAVDKFTCVSIEECVISHSYAHNSREESPNYAIKERAQLNESFLFDVDTIHTGFDFATAEPYREKRVEKVKNLHAYEEYCKSIYSEKVGQKPQKKTRFLKEAVVVIDESTTLEQMKELSYKLGKIAGGWKPLQLFIHRDEGHNDLDTGERIWNYHAHIVFDTQDKDTGKTLKVNSKHYQEMQTIASEVLGMRRGEHNPDRKHLNAQDYKKKKRLEEVEKLKKQKEAFLATLNSLNKQKQEASEKVAELASKVANLEGEKENAENYIEEAKEIVSKLADEYANADEYLLVWELKERLSKGMIYKKLSEQVDMAKKLFRDKFNEEMTKKEFIYNLNQIRTLTTISFPQVSEKNETHQENKESKLEEKVQEVAQKKDPKKVLYAPKNYGKTDKKKGVSV